MLDNYKPEWRPATTAEGNTDRSTGESQSGGRNTNQVSFLQANGHQLKFLRGSDSSFFVDVECRLYNIKGHYKRFCPVVVDSTGRKIRHNRPSEGNRDTSTTEGNDPGEVLVTGYGTAGQEVSLNSGVLLNQHAHTHINPSWILLDS